eukprot:2741838-Prymnesium_polylepis.1
MPHALLTFEGAIAACEEFGLGGALERLLEGEHTLLEDVAAKQAEAARDGDVGDIGVDEEDGDYDAQAADGDEG